MELRQIGRTIWKWLWLIVLGILAAGSIAYIVSSGATPIYRASAQILIQQASNPTGQQWAEVLTSERLAANYARLLTTRPTLEEVARRLNLPDLTSRIIVDPVRETQIIVLHVEDPNPALATAIANELPRVFIEQNESQQQRRFDISLATFDQQITAVEADIEQAQEQLQALQVLEDEGEELTLDQDAQRARFLTSLAQYRASLADMLGARDDVKRSAALSVDNVVVVEPAVEPTEPVRPRVLINTLIALAMAALLMTAVAFLIEYLDDTVKLPEDATRVTGLPALGSIVQHRNASSRRQLIALHHPKSPFSEGYRTLRTNIQFSSLDKPLSSLLVTSASPGEGKSTTVANLAVVMAQTDKRVILVDTDLRRPVLHEMFGVPNGVGLTSALLQPADSDLAPFLQPTEISNLKLLTSGPLPPNPSELLGSQRMKELIDNLQNHADVILFDSPPILAVTDAAVLVRWLDGVLVVIESAGTREGAAKRATQELAKVNANILGITVNQLSSRLAGSHYYYYDYYEDRSNEDGSDRNGDGGGRRRRSFQKGRSAQDSGQLTPARGILARLMPGSRSSVQDV